MENFKIQVFLAMAAFLFVSPVAHGWGEEGHYTVCKIAQSRLSEAAAEAVGKLLPESANGELASVCSWADNVRSIYKWSAALHFANTPENLCTYNYQRDCKDAYGVPDRCAAGAINNYTEQLTTYSRGRYASQYNLTEALLFLSHLIGDIHEPMHVGFASDKGGNTIAVHWYTMKSNLHHVWDNNIIETAEERYYGSQLNELIDALQKNISTGWANHVSLWERCHGNKIACPDIYASEGIKAACAWGYKGVTQDSVLQDEYFLTRFPIVQWRLAQGGVRLAAILNRIFDNTTIYKPLSGS